MYLVQKYHKSKNAEKSTSELSIFFIEIGWRSSENGDVEIACSAGGGPYELPQIPSNQLEPATHMEEPWFFKNFKNYAQRIEEFSKNSWKLHIAVFFLGKRLGIPRLVSCRPKPSLGISAPLKISLGILTGVFSSDRIPNKILRKNKGKIKRKRVKTIKIFRLRRAR